MIKNLLEITKPEDKGRVAIPAVNLFNYSTVRGVLEASAQLGRPIIIRAPESTARHYGEDFISTMVKTIGKKLGVDHASHLDHAADLNLIKRCIENGFTQLCHKD